MTLGPARPSLVDMPPSKRPRTVRREAEREASRLARAREALAALEDGGAPERPIVVASASQIEPHAASMRCPVCGDGLRVVDHEVRHTTAGSLRVVTAKSPQCGRVRTIWFSVRAPLPN